MKTNYLLYWFSLRWSQDIAAEGLEIKQYRFFR